MGNTHSKRHYCKARRRYDQLFDSLPLDQQIEQVGILLAWFVDAISIPAQEAIDTVAASLLAEVDI